MRIARGKNGLPENLRPKCQLIGKNGNVFVILEATRRALREAGFDNKAEEFMTRVRNNEFHSYDSILVGVMTYVDVC